MAFIEEVQDSADEFSPPTTNCAQSFPDGTAIEQILDLPRELAAASVGYTRSREAMHTDHSQARLSPIPYIPSKYADLTQLQSSPVNQTALIRAPILSPPALTTPVIIPSSYSKSTGPGVMRTNFVEVVIQFQASSHAPRFWVCLDTGCGLSLISRSFLARAMPDVKLTSCALIPFRGINDKNPSLTSHMVQLTYYIHGDFRFVNGTPVDDRGKFAAFIRHFLVVPELFCDMILGTDAQINAGMTLDFHHMSMTIRSCDFMMTTLHVVPKKQAQVQWRVGSVQATVVPPFSSKLIAIDHKPLPPDILLEFVPLLDSHAM